MKKFIITTIYFLFIVAAFAQKGIDGLIQAEKNFAAYSVANSTKEAFLKFMDSSSLVFDNGKAVNGIEFWEKREKRPGVLNWQPIYASISSSGDFGFTSGPWTFQYSKDDSIVARGIYTTVWHINKNGEWKFLIDLGVDNTPAITDTVLKVLTTGKNTKTGSLKSLLLTEKKYINFSMQAASSADLYFSSSAILHRNGKKPEDGLQTKRTFPDKVEYEIAGSGIASSGDFGFVYGNSVINGKSDNYLRIWRRKRNYWKIAVEVLRY